MEKFSLSVAGAQSSLVDRLDGSTVPAEGRSIGCYKKWWVSRLTSPQLWS